LDAKQLPRVGSGRHPTTTYYRADGERGFIGLFARGWVPSVGEKIADRKQNYHAQAEPSGEAEPALHRRRRMSEVVSRWRPRRTGLKCG